MKQVPSNATYLATVLFNETVFSKNVFFHRKNTFRRNRTSGAEARTPKPKAHSTQTYHFRRIVIGAGGI